MGYSPDLSAIATTTVLKSIVRLEPIAAAGEFARVVASEVRGVSAHPVGEGGRAGGRRVGAEQVLHETLDLFASDKDVPGQLAHCPACEIAQRGWNGKNRPVFANYEADLAHQLAVCKRLGAGRIDGFVEK